MLLHSPADGFNMSLAPKLRPRLCQGFLWGIATIYSPQVQAMGAEEREK